MKNIIKQILREETLGLSDAEKNAAYKMMNHITKGYYWYHDTPEQPFEYTRGSIWLINPDTKEWMLEFDESGHLRYHYKTHDTFSMYLNMKVSDFESFIKIWVEDVLKRGVVSTRRIEWGPGWRVEDVLKRGVVSIVRNEINWDDEIKDVLENGVVNHIPFRDITTKMRHHN